MPTRVRSLSTSVPGPVISSLPIHIRPDCGSSSRLMQRKSVDFPEPEGPMMHVVTDAGTVSETSCSTVWLPNESVTFSRRTPFRSFSRIGLKAPGTDADTPLPRVDNTGHRYCQGEIDQ